MPASASRNCSTCQNHQGSQIRFFSQLAHFFALQLAQKGLARNTPPGRSRCRVGAPRGRRRYSERARGFLTLRGKTCGAALRKIPREPDSRPRNVEKRPRQSAHYGTHVHIHATATPPTGSAPRRPPQPDLRRCAHSATPPTGSAQRRACTGWPYNLYRSAEPPAGSSEDLA